MEFRVLGSIDVSSGGQPLPLGGPRQRALLAYLLLHGHEVVSAERLIEELWYDPPAGGVQTVHTQVSRLRRALGGRIATAGHGYELRLESGELDLDLFRSLLAEAGEASEPVERSRLLREADSLWHGEPLQGLEAPFVAAEARALEELRLVAVEQRIGADLEAGRHAALVAELSALVARHPLRERLRGQLILALYRSGRQAEALEVYRETRRVLADELGLDPSPELRELEQAILRHDSSLEVPVAPPLAPSPSVSLQPVPLALKRRGWFLAGVAGVLLLASGAAAAVAVVETEGPSGQVAVPPSSNVSQTTPGRVTHPPQTTMTVHHRVRARHVHYPVKPVAPAEGSPSTSAPTTTVVRVRQSSPPTTEPTTPTRHKPRRSSVTATPTTTTAASKRAPKPPPPKLSTIADTFGGNEVDGTIWYQIYEGSGWDMGEHDGHLEFNFPPSSTPGGQYNVFGGHVGTLCNFSGEFDARVDFNLLSWPAANGLTVTLWAFLGPENNGYQSWRASHVSDAGGEQYGSYTGTSVGVSLGDLNGTLRLARRNGLITAYFLHNGHWQSLTSGLETENAKIAVGVQSAPGASLAGQTVTVDFTNFTVTGTEVVCPPGATPPSG